ncbi:MAG: hypothetical protein LQ347_006992 [Umbilicaria vellea]|nr:MAG: hypothetical protein LQ347_006992 [Umbilicaria vellea]
MTEKTRWPVWDQMPTDHKEHAIMLRQAANTGLNHIANGQKPPSNTLQEVLRALVAFTEQTIQEPRIQTVLDEVRKLARETTTRDNAIDEKLTIIKNQPAGSYTTSSAATTSWAGVANRLRDSQFTYSSPSSSIRGAPIPPTPYNKNTEIIVRMNDKEASKANAAKEPRELAEKVNQYIRNNKISTKDIRAARTLPSGDIAITTATEEEATKLREQEGWMSVFSEKAKAVAQMYGVLVHGVRIKDLNTTDMEKGIERIKTQNKDTVQLDIMWMGYLNRPKDGQQTASLIVECRTAEQANSAIREGLAIGSVMYRECPKDKPIKCTVCKGSHEAWDKTCIKKKLEIERMRAARFNTPAFHEISKAPAQTISQTPEWEVVSYAKNNTSRGGPSATTRGRGGGLSMRGGLQSARPILEARTTLNRRPRANSNSTASQPPERVGTRSQSLLRNESSQKEALAERNGNIRRSKTINLGNGKKRRGGDSEEDDNGQEDMTMDIVNSQLSQW